MPPTSTAQPNAIIGGSKYGTRNSANMMNDRLSSTGVNAGMENLLYVLRMLPTNDDSEISRIYGKIMGNNCTAKSKRVLPCRAKPLAVTQITAGAANIPIVVMMHSQNVNIPETCCTNWRVSSSARLCL